MIFKYITSRFYFIRNWPNRLSIESRLALQKKKLALYLTAIFILSERLDSQKYFGALIRVCGNRCSVEQIHKLCPFLFVWDHLIFGPFQCKHIFICHSSDKENKSDEIFSSGKLLTHNVKEYSLNLDLDFRKMCILKLNLKS